MTGSLWPVRAKNIYKAIKAMVTLIIVKPPIIAVVVVITYVFSRASQAGNGPRRGIAQNSIFQFYQQLNK